MRPLELDLTAFRSYDRTTIDLRPHELVVITGDTGAGKTSLLDAVAFAVFGRTPEHGRPGDLLTLGRDHGEVRLTFAARGEVWRVTRRYGTRAPEPRLLLERLADDGGAAVETISGAEAATARLDAVVGMGFRAFTSAVLLAQGRFAEFLTARPADRDAILRELFGVASLEGARRAAQRAEDAAMAQAGLRERDAAALPAHGAGARTEAARAARAAAGGLAEALRLRPLAARLAEHAGEAAEYGRRRATAAEVAAALPDDDAARELAGALTAARERIAAAEGVRARRAEEARAAAEARDEARVRDGGGAADLAALRERAESAARLAAAMPGRQDEVASRAGAAEAAAARAAEAARALADADAATAWLARAGEAEAADAAAREAERALRAAEERRAAAEGAERETRQAREAAQLHDLAAAIRAGLAPGARCPVCGAAVAEHPAEAPELDAAEEALASARAALAEAVRTHAAAEQAARAARGSADGACARAAAAAAALAQAGVAEAEAPARRDARAGLADAARELAEAARAAAADAGAERASLARDTQRLAEDRARLGGWAQRPDPAAALEEALAGATERQRAADATATALAEASADAARAASDLAALESGRVAALRATVARAAERGRLEAPGDDVAPEELIASAARLRATALDAAERLAARAREASAREAEARDALAAAGGALAVREPEQVEPAARRLAAARDDARGALARLEGVAADARRLAGEATAARRRAELHHQVALDLRANAFPRFLLARYRERLAQGASAHLQALSAGAYRFSGTGADPMAVVDQRRGERARPAGTLSGGERFLASLALALGLGDVAAESSGRLDCLFLDEGFSTLDADSLEQALAGVERLAGDGRLVGVITHLPGVAERLGATIRVAKDPEGVSRIVAA